MVVRDTPFQPATVTTIMALNLSTLRTPGVYIDEVAKFPPSVVPVETAIPAFLGYTRNSQHQGQDLIGRPMSVESLLEFEQMFGPAPAPTASTLRVGVDPDGKVLGSIPDPAADANGRFRLAYALRHFYDNGGGRCYVVSIGDCAGSSGLGSEIVADHERGLEALAREDEPTLIVLPDLGGIAADPDDEDERAAALAAYHSVLIKALDQCATLGDRFLICDLWTGMPGEAAKIQAFRD